MNNEPKSAFPYKPPTNKIKKKYAYIFHNHFKLPSHYFKFFIDKLLSIFLLILLIPILILLKICFVIEGVLISENKGPMFFYYNAVSAGKIFRKYKIRIIKLKFIDDKAAKKGDWLAYKNEWNPECRTFLGMFVKKFYFDEIPQLYNILLGDMSFVGPRPLSVLHYERDLNQGNVVRKYLKGGLLGYGHIMKGKPLFGNPIFEYKYLDYYINKSQLSLILLDFKIIISGIILILKGGGY